MATHRLPPLTTIDSSFMPDQQNDQYVIRKEEKTAVEHCEQVPDGKQLQADIFFMEVNIKTLFYRETQEEKKAIEALFMLYMLSMFSNVGKIWLLYFIFVIFNVSNYCRCIGSNIQNP